MVITHCPALAEAAVRVGDVQIRSRATVGGSTERSRNNRLLRGRGRYSADVLPTGTLPAAIQWMG
ncbi:MAG: hypothetical protein EXR86_01140 [Gammaproteobacteria bacterium]|nr:hypothetical protein [Gammaproteobacteria bacterium]